MAATDHRPGNPSLAALTAAALALPGLAPSRVLANDESFELQIGHYRETARELAGLDSAYSPLRADSLAGKASVTLPAALRLHFNFQQDTWSGATPIATAPVAMQGNRASAPDGVSEASPYLNGDLYFDAALRPLATDRQGQLTQGTDTEVVHTLSSASPETRRQVDLGLEHEREAYRLRGHLGGSLEPDYRSHWVGGELRFYLDRKLTHLDLGARQTSGEVEATLDHDALPYLDTRAFNAQIENRGQGIRVLHGSRDDSTIFASLGRVLDRDSEAAATVSYTHSRGYLENPYRAVSVAFLDPAQQFLAPPDGFYGQVRALLEQRPDERKQLSLDLTYSRWFEIINGALTAGYQYFDDDWDITAHTFNAAVATSPFAGWTFTPRVRYYSQTAASFYSQYLVTAQAYRTTEFDPQTGDLLPSRAYDPTLLPDNFSSDYRLSGFGSLSAGLSVAYALASGVSLEGGFDYYRHAGSLKLGGAGEADYADFGSWAATLALRADLDTHTNLMDLFSSPDHHGHVDHAEHPAIPAGIIGGHMLHEQGNVMLGYRFGYTRQGGDFLRGSDEVSDRTLRRAACAPRRCINVPTRMSAYMHMLDIMYAVTDRLTLMLMPQYMDMSMTMRTLPGAQPDIHSSHRRHATGSWGDTGMYGLVNLWHSPQHSLHATLGFSAPTGESDIRYRRNHQQDIGYVDYGMQTGSGTWDAMPSLTYTYRWQQWSFGGQMGGVVRLEDANESGYALGNLFQISGWASHPVTDWLAGSLRVQHTRQGAIRGAYNDIHPTSSPPDNDLNYGGRHLDLRLGLSAAPVRGALKGNRLSVEWLQPISTHVNGYQLDRTGSLFASWQHHF